MSEPANQPVLVDSRPFMEWRLRQVAKIALLTGAVAVLCLLVAIHYLSGKSGSSYQEILSAHAMTHRHLAPALLLSGLVLVTLTGLITWLIALYSTFRVAGPVHRFGLQLKRQIHEGPLPVEQFREGDFLQVEHLHFSAAASRLQYHYDTMSELTDLALSQLEAEEGTPGREKGLVDTMQRLQELDRLVKL
ncbi:MAG: hypothetical protein HQL64_05500 [Magnetococcales bacterium]|nr:hypothetical protein [Magnetococcales bacterium]